MMLFNNSQLWTEKYRPKKLNEMLGQKEIINRLKLFVQTKSLPNVLFSGPPGVGKTTAALCIAKELFGDSWKENLLELNASDERGIETIRNKVKNFARTKAISNVPFKLILLDEADALTREAQSALRRIMEKYSNTCRFILDCNYVSKIISPIQSRCAVFKFKYLDKKDVVDYLNKIVEKEGLKANKDVLEIIFEISEGDVRKAINIIQGSAILSKEITQDVIYGYSSALRPEEIKNLLIYISKKDFNKARDEIMNLMISNGLSSLDLLKQLCNIIINSQLPVDKKIRIVNEIATTEYRIVEGSDDILQLNGLLARLLLLW